MVKGDPDLGEPAMKEEKYYIERTQYQIVRMVPPGDTKWVWSTPKAIILAKGFDQQVE